MYCILGYQFHLYSLSTLVYTESRKQKTVRLNSSLFPRSHSINKVGKDPNLMGALQAVWPTAILLSPKPFLVWNFHRFFSTFTALDTSFYGWRNKIGFSHHSGKKNASGHSKVILNKMINRISHYFSTFASSVSKYTNRFFLMIGAV